VNLAVDPLALANGPRLVAAPHAISFALTSVLAPIEKVAGIERAAGMVLRPVSDFGEAGIEELHRQTLSLLNFEEIPKGVFGRQIAFNLLPESAVRENPAGAALHARLAAEVDRIFGWTRPRATLRLMVAPVFHGHAVLVHVVVREPISEAALRKVLSETAGVTLRHGPRAELTPVEIAEREGELAVDAVPDEADERGFWVTLMGSQFREAAATNAVEIAGRLLSG